MTFNQWKCGRVLSGDIQPMIVWRSCVQHGLLLLLWFKSEARKEFSLVCAFITHTCTHTHTHTHTHMHTHMHSHTHIHMYIQELGGNIHGDCSDFEVVPGYGLKCTVSGLEEYSRGETQHSGTIVIRHTCVTPETSLVAESGEGASQAKKYQVKGEGEGERREKGRGREKEWRDKGRERGSLCDSSLHLQVLIGNRGWMSQNGVEIVGDMEKDIQGFEEHGQTVVMVAIDGEY